MREKGYALRIVCAFDKSAAVLILMVFSWVLHSCANDSENVAPGQTAIAVKVNVVERSDEEVIKTYTGTLEGEKQAVIYAKIAEAVEAIHVREGELVTAQQVLISLDKSGPSSRYQEALSLYRNAEKNYQKMDYLFQEGAVSESQFDAAKTDYEVAQAGFEAAAQLVEIQSPIDGVVTSLKVSKGDYLSPGQELVTVATTDRLRVKFGIHAAEVAKIEPKTPVTILAEENTHKVQGSVVSVARSADPSTRTFQVEAVVDNSDGMLKPGMFVRVEVTVQQLTDVMAVPRQAVLDRSDHQVVFVVVNGVAYERRVTTGVDLGGQVVVSSGLAEGDTLITLGQHYLQDSARVQITGTPESVR